MPDNSRKTPLAQTLPAMARKQIDGALELSGMALPCHVVEVDGAIVTVAFDVQTNDTLPKVTIPILWPEYIRLPIQVGDKGVTVPFDAYLGPSSGLGGSTVSFLQPSNLGALGFLPIGNKNWSAVDGNVLVMYGPNGVTLRDKASNTIINVTTDSINMTAPGGVSITSPDVSTSGNLRAGTGASGTFTAASGETVTVQDGIIINIF